MSRVDVGRLKGGREPVPPRARRKCPGLPLQAGASRNLRGLTALKVGQVVALPRDAAHDVRLVCEGRELFRCDLGQSGGHYTVRIDEPVPAALAEL